MTSQATDDRSSGFLLRCAQHGDASAFGHLLRRCLPGVLRWAHGRLPRWMRTGLDTADLVHDVVVRTIPRIGTFDGAGHDALAAYLRQGVLNRIRDEHRRFARRPPCAELSENIVEPAPSPLSLAITQEERTRYVGALTVLPPADRELIVGHIELGYSHQQLGCMTGRTANAARMALHRALCRLALQMRAD